MLKNLDRNNVAVLIDFDGTITKEDTNDKLFKVFANDDINEIYNQDEERSMTYVEFMDRAFSKLKIDEKTYLDFILNEIEISPGFIGFYKKLKSLHIPIIVISGGFINGILPFLDKYGIEDVEVLANNLNFNGEDITVDFYHNRDPKCCDIGCCGNCKNTHIERFKEEFENVVFIGDGITDEPIANKADMLFAKDGLLDYCREHEIDCIPWDDFFNIKNILFKPTN